MYQKSILLIKNTYINIYIVRSRIVLPLTFVQIYKPMIIFNTTEMFD